MDDRFKNKFRISPTRLTGWDYGSSGLYYITICTKDRVHYFGDIVSDQNSETHNYASLQKTPIAEIANKNWFDIPNHFPFVELDDFVIMPNHIHSILFINKPDKTNWQPNKFGSQSQNLGSIIRNYKGSVKTYATTNNIEFAWQPRYYDRVIRNEKEYANVRQYIFNNPDNWLLNGDNEDNLYP
jgi:putative transposase